jgi:hypothetical protein
VRLFLSSFQSSFLELPFIFYNLKIANPKINYLFYFPCLALFCDSSAALAFADAGGQSSVKRK